MENKIKQFEERAKQIFGDSYVGFVGNKWRESGQVAAVTNIQDEGEDVPAPYIDEFTAGAKQIFGRVSVMPYPVMGKLIYVVAGLGRRM